MNLEQYEIEEAARLVDYRAKYPEHADMLRPLSECAWLSVNNLSALRSSRGCDLNVNRKVIEMETRRFAKKYGITNAWTRRTVRTVREADLSDMANVAAWIGVLEFLDAIDCVTEDLAERGEILAVHAEDYVSRRTKEA